MSQVLSSTLSVQIYVRTLTVKVSAALKLIVWVCGTTLLDGIEDEKTVVLVKLKSLGDFFRPRTIFILVVLNIAIFPVHTFVFIGRWVLEKVQIKVLILQDALIERFFLIDCIERRHRSPLKRIHLRCECLDGLRGLWIRKLLDERILPLRRVKKLIIDFRWGLELRRRRILKLLKFLAGQARRKHRCWALSRRHVATADAVIVHGSVAWARAMHSCAVALLQSALAANLRQTTWAHFFDDLMVCRHEWLRLGVHRTCRLRFLQSVTKWLLLRRQDSFGRLVQLLEDLCQLIDCQLQVEWHVGSIQSPFVESLATFKQPEAVNLGDWVTLDEQMVQQIILQDELHSFIILIAQFVPEALQLSSQRALCRKRLLFTIVTFQVAGRQGVRLTL